MSMSLMHIHHLPPELITAVFAQSQDAECAVPCHWDSTQPLVYARVCRRWHALVTHDPLLWSHIHVEPSTRGLARARLWLERSQSVPLRVSICARNMPNDGWEHTLSLFVPALVDMFVPHLSRIRAFHSHLGGHVVPALFPPGGLVSMPVLEQLGLRIDDASSHSLVTAFLDSSLGVLDAPCLHSLTVSDITPIADAIAPVLPQLRSLDVLDARLWAHASIFPALLARCKKVEHCTIAFPSNCYFASPVEPINLPDLRTLAMEWPFLFEPAPVFRALTAPKLEHLTLSHLTRQLILPPTTFSALRSLAQSASSTLRSITLVGCNLPTQDESAALFEDCVSLERLSLTHCQHVDMLLNPLTPSASPTEVDGLRASPPTRAWLCPRLLQVDINHIKDADVRPIVTFARSRCIPTTSSSSTGLPTSMLSSLESIPNPIGLDIVRNPLSAACTTSPTQNPRPPPADSVRPPSASSKKNGSDHSYLQHLTLDVDITSLSRNARVLLLSGLYSLHHDIDITGPCGDLFARADAYAETSVDPCFSS